MDIRNTLSKSTSIIAHRFNTYGYYTHGPEYEL